MILKISIGNDSETQCGYLRRYLFVLIKILVIAKHNIKGHWWWRFIVDALNLKVFDNDMCNSKIWFILESHTNIIIILYYIIVPLFY